MVLPCLKCVEKQNITCCLNTFDNGWCQNHCSCSSIWPDVMAHFFTSLLSQIEKILTKNVTFKASAEFRQEVILDCDRKSCYCKKCALFFFFMKSPALKHEQLWICTQRTEEAHHQVNLISPYKQVMMCLILLAFFLCKLTSVETVWNQFLFIHTET